MKLLGFNLQDYLEVLAFSPDDLMRDIDTRTQVKSGPCVSSATAFDNQSFTATFSTTCIEHNWMQTVIFADAAKLQVSRTSNKKIVFNLSAQEKPKNEENKQEETPIIEPKTPNFEIKTLDDLRSQHPEIYNGNVYAGCNCPAFAYFYSYIVSQLDANLRNQYEGRFPIIRNPQLMGTVCKHLVSVFRTFF